MRPTTPCPPCLVLALAAGVLGCASAGQGRYESDRREVERHTPPYDPAWATKPSARHVAIPIVISGGALQPSGGPAQLRRGGMPSRSRAGGAVSVIYRSADGQEVGRYGIEDPALARSCDLAGGKGGTRRVARGRAEILVPADARIASIEITRASGQGATFDVRAQIAEALKGDAR